MYTVYIDLLTLLLLITPLLLKVWEKIDDYCWDSVHECKASAHWKWRLRPQDLCSENKRSHFDSISQDAPSFHSWMGNPAHGPSFQLSLVKVTHDPWAHQVIYKPEFPTSSLSLLWTFNWGAAQRLSLTSGQRFPFPHYVLHEVDTLNSLS